jgi:hypothetical protein
VTALQETTISFALEEKHVAEIVAGATGFACAWASPLLPAVSPTAKFVAPAGTAKASTATESTAANSGTSGLGTNIRGPRSRRCLLAVILLTDQLVQLSVAGVVVDVAAPPVAVMPVREGIEK